MEVKKENMHHIYFAGGCFWGVAEYFSRIPGVCDAIAGYANGNIENPTYEQVCSDTTGFAEAVHIQYDSKVVSLGILTEQFFEIIDPLSVNRQGNDIGSQYRTGIYYTEETDQPALQTAVNIIQKRYTQKLAVEVKALQNFYPAEEYHQDYLKKHPTGYCHIQFQSLDQLVLHPNGTVGKRIDDQKLRQRLTAEQYEITQKGKTERAFTGKYWDQSEPGLYVDIVTGEPLFTSADKFESGCGWPSFTKPVETDVVTEQNDSSFGMRRIEIRSRKGDFHLGHVFEDGPQETGGLRYCINSAALRFVPYSQMEDEGYEAYLPLITKV